MNVERVAAAGLIPWTINEQAVRKIPRAERADVTHEVSRNLVRIPTRHKRTPKEPIKPVASHYLSGWQPI